MRSLFVLFGLMSLGPVVTAHAQEGRIANKDAFYLCQEADPNYLVSCVSQAYSVLGAADSLIYSDELEDEQTQVVFTIFITGVANYVADTILAEANLEQMAYEDYVLSNQFLSRTLDLALNTSTEDFSDARLLFFVTVWDFRLTLFEKEGEIPAEHSERYALAKEKLSQQVEHLDLLGE